MGRCLTKWSVTPGMEDVCAREDEVGRCLTSLVHHTPLWDGVHKCPTRLVSDPQGLGWVGVSLG